MASVFLKNSNYCYFRWKRDSKWTRETFRTGDLLKKHFNVFFGVEAGSDHLVFFLLVCF